MIVTSTSIPSTQRSIINVSLEDYQRVIKRFYDPDVIERGSRYRPCGRHHQSDGVTDTLTDLPTQSGLIVCSVDYVMFYGLGDSVGSKCVQVCYRYPGCQVKCEFTLKPDGKIHFYGWGACHAK